MSKIYFLTLRRSGPSLRPISLPLKILCRNGAIRAVHPTGHKIRGRYAHTILPQCVTTGASLQVRRHTPCTERNERERKSHQPSSNSCRMVSLSGLPASGNQRVQVAPTCGSLLSTCTMPPSANVESNSCLMSEKYRLVAGNHKSTCL